MSPHHSDKMPQWPQVSRIILCMAKVNVSEWVSQSVSEWQGHLLSCSGQLKSLLCQSYIANIPIKSYKFCSKNFEHEAASCHWYFRFLLMKIFYHSFQLTINAQFTIVIPLHNHITVGPHTKCAESVLSMAHVSRFCNKEIGPKNYSKVCNHSTLGVTPASPSETVFANNRLCLCCRRNVKSFEFWRRI